MSSSGGKLLREVTVTIKEEESPQACRVTKWSVRKYLSMIAMVGDLFDQALKKLSRTGADFDVSIFLARIGIEICQSEARFVKLIKESVAEPKFSDEQILELDPEDALTLVDAALEVNLTSKLQKKMLGMFEKVLGPIQREASSASAESTDESEKSKTGSGDPSASSPPGDSASET